VGVPRESRALWTPHPNPPPQGGRERAFSAATSRKTSIDPDHPPMPPLTFGEWRPDISDYEASTTQNVLNVLPRGDDSRPLPS
jgi:hypothetical protein